MLLSIVLWTLRFFCYLVLIPNILEKEQLSPFVPLKIQIVINIKFFTGVKCLSLEGSNLKVIYFSDETLLSHLKIFAYNRVIDFKFSD